MRTFLFILLAGLLGACSDDGELNGAVEADNLELSKNELKLSNVAGSSTVDITATADWVAAVVEPVGDAENMWLTLSKDSGTGNDELRLFVTENTDGKIIRSIADVRWGDEIITQVGDGNVISVVQHTEGR